MQSAEEEAMDVGQFGKLVQARMRGIGEGQRVTILVIPEVFALMERQLAKRDAPPPAVLGMMKSVRGISSMNWNINMLVDAPQTRDGWWLLNTFSQHASNGYASQIMHVWDADGTRIGGSRT